MPISTYKLIKQFSSHPDYSVFVILPETGDLYSKVKSLDITVTTIKFFRMRSPKHIKGFIKFLLCLPRAITQVVSYLKGNHIAVLHFSDIIDFPFYPCAHFAGSKALAHIRNAQNHALTRLGYVWFLHRYIDQAICISRFIKSHYSLPDYFSRVIYNPGPDLALFNRQKSHPAAINFGPHGIIIGMVGKFLKIKGHRYFLDLARIINSTLPGACRFIIVGNIESGHEAYSRFIHRYADNLGLSSILTISHDADYERIPAFLSQMDIFIHMSIVPEGLGGVVLEAMSMGLAIVAFESGGVGECFDNGKSGFLVPRKDIRAAAEKVSDLVQNPALRQRLGLQATFDLAKKFSYEKHFSEVEKFYAERL